MEDDIYIGLMSGTSLDGIDAALVQFKKNEIHVLATLCLPLTKDLQSEIKSLVNPTTNELNRLMMLDVQLGQAFAEAANTLVKNSSINKENINAIGSHGQTIRHFPNNEFPTTLQIGDANIIAEQTAITTVADFRRRDIAVGGQGAPLVPAFHEQIFRHETKNRVILNLGGIANITLIAADKNIPVTGFDTGPANTLINLWIHQQQNKNYDESGKWAATGIVNDNLLSELLSDNYFKLTPPKSTGTEYFNADWLSKNLSVFSDLKAEDIQATLTALTAKTISDAINNNANKLFHVDEVIVCGGGVHNAVLLEKLQQDLAEVEINSSAKYGLDPDYIEATAFAWLARQTMQRKSGNLPEVTGAKRKVILGSIYLT